MGPVNTKIAIPVVALLALALLGGGAVYAYFFSNLRSSPAALALPSPPPSPVDTTSPSPARVPAAGVAGAWQVGSGSLAGYRVSELFVGQTAAHDAVARTSGVTGALTITEAGGVYTLETASITVQLSTLQSTDSVVGYNVSNRDRIVTRTLGVDQFPTAVFTGGPLALPAGLESGQAFSIALPGRLTVHGVTKAVTANFQVRATGATAQAAGSIAILMTDYGINPPSIGFTTVQPAVTIEFQVNLGKA